MNLTNLNLSNLLVDAGKADTGITIIKNGNCEEFVTYSELYSKACHRLSGMQSKGILSDSEVVIQCNDILEFIITFWSCILGRIIAIPTTPSGSVEEKKRLSSIIRILNNPIIISDDRNSDCNAVDYFSCIDLDFSGNEDVILPDIQENDIAFIQFSSGSTGNPKGVVLTHKNLLTNISAIIHGILMTDEDSTLNWMPLTHDMGLIGFHLTPLCQASNQFHVPVSLFIKNPLIWMKKISEHKVTITCSPNFGYQHFLKYFNKDNNSLLDDLSCIRIIFNGAEPISYNVSKRFTEALSSTGLQNNVIFPVYGMAEASLAVTFPELNKKIDYICVDRLKTDKAETLVFVDEQHIHAMKLVAVGKPIENCYVKITDDNGKACKEGCIGHILISGANVTSGYYHNEVETKKTITKDNWLITGDLGLNWNGSLFITGREKDVIFVNGSNFYSHDLEEIISEIPETGVGKAVITSSFNYVEGKDDIIVFIYTRKQIEDFCILASEVKRLLFKIAAISPTYVIPVQKIPKTTSGKLKRFELVNNFLNGDYEDILKLINNLLINDIALNKFSKIQQKIYHLISEALGKDWDFNDSFISAGGDSITMIKVINSIEQKLGIQVSLNDLTSALKLQELCSIIESKAEKQSLVYPLVTADPSTNHLPFPLTPVQEAYLIGRNASLELGGVAAHGYYEIETSLDLERLNKALLNVITRHDMLRAIILPEGQQQILEHTPSYVIATIDARLWDEGSKNEYICNHRDQVSHRVFDTTRWPLFEISALQLDDTTHCLFFSLDLLIADGFSIGLIIKDLLHFYHHPNEVVKKSTLSFRDYVLGLEGLKTSGHYQRDREYWMTKAEGFSSSPALPLLCDVATIKAPIYNRLEKKVAHHQWNVIQETARKHNVTPSSLLCAIYSLVLSRYSNQERLALNVTIFNRYPFHADVNNLVGDFTSVILLDAEVNTQDFWESAAKTQTKLVDAIEHRHFDGVGFIRELARIQGAGGKALMPVVFTSMLFGNDQNQNNTLDELGHIKYGISQTSQVYLDFQASEDKDGLIIRWDFVQQLFEPELVQNMFEMFLSALVRIYTGQPDIKPPLPHYDLALIDKYNSTEVLFPEETLPSLFLKTIQDYPENIAVVCAERTLTYWDLHQASERIARYLKFQGVKKGDRIGVMAFRNTSAIANIIGILKAGAIYVPISPEYPQERQRYILENSGCNICLNGDEKSANEDASHDSVCANAITPADLAYIIYTSGSTGTPKGVSISHASAVNTILAINKRFAVNSLDRILGLSSMGFDLSVYDIFGALSTGASLIMVPDLKDMSAVKKLIEIHQITIWNSVPAIMELLIDSVYQSANQQGHTESLRLVMLSGDWVPLGLPGKVKDTFGCAEVISLGGATECSIWSIYYPVTDVYPSWKSIPYGMPLENQMVYVLDNNNQSCPVGVEGEIHIGGKGLAEGYDNDSEKTNCSFVHYPNFGRLYKTGDFGILHTEGWVEFRGRKDGQVKIAGHRIELAEIEQQLQTFAGIRATVATIVNNGNGIFKIAAYYVSDNELHETELKTYLKEKLPEYMIPLWLMKIHEIPLSSNGKVDRKKLPNPFICLKTIGKQVARSNTEKYVAKLWEDILETKELSIYDNFFESGGDSLKAIKLFSRIKDKYPIQMFEIFENQTIEKLAKVLNKFDIEEGTIFDNLIKQYQRNKPNLDVLTPAIDSIYAKYLQNSLETSVKQNFTSENNYSVILITGTTGYFGAYLLYEFAVNTNCKIFTIVRAKNDNDARERLKLKLEFYFDEITAIKLLNKVSVFAGDLSEANFRLEEKDYNFLAKCTDAIINSAASVAHWDRYEKLYKTNVKSVINIIEFANSIKKKDIHHISSCILASGNIPGTNQAILTEDHCDIGQQISDYYGKSKFEAEKIIEKARETGTKISVYRMGNIAFNSQSGKFQENIHDNAFYKLVKLLFTFKKIPSIPYKVLDFTFVNEAAMAVRKIVMVKSLLNNTFHLMNPHKIDTDMLHGCLSNGYNDLELISYINFMRFLENESTHYQSHSIDNVLIHTDMLLAFQSDTRIIFATERTVEILKHLDFQWTKPDKSVFKKMMTYIKKVHFLEK